LIAPPVLNDGLNPACRRQEAGYVLSMPFLSIQTNTSLSDDQQAALLNSASKIVASELGKPESYVMVSFVHAQQMKFAGNDSPTAFLELSAIGMPDSHRNPLVSALTKLVADACKINPERIFVVLADIQARFWASNGAIIG
jgi:phenylpyruvate tautomerase